MSRTVAPAPAGHRDHRVDFYRGIALAMIFVNHVPGTLWENYTNRNFGFSDAAEIFVFLAGFASAFAYGRLFLGGERLVASLKAWRRAGILYLVHMTMTVIGIGLFTWAALALGEGELMKHNGLITFLTRPMDTLIGLTMLGHQIGYVNILPMYAMILLMVPALLTLAAFGRGTMLAASAALWIACGIWRFDMPNYPYPGGWYFNPFAWQFLFAIGLYCGLAKWQRGYSVLYDRRVYAAALVYLALAFLFVRFSLWGSEHALGLPFLIGQFDKTHVTVPRLLHVLALIYVFAHAPKTSPLSTIARGNPFAMLGRHSLPVFAVGTMLSLACQLVRYERPADALFDAVLLLACLGLQFLLAFYLDWWREAQKQAALRAAARSADAARVQAHDMMPAAAAASLEVGPVAETAGSGFLPSLSGDIRPT